MSEADADTLIRFSAEQYCVEMSDKRSSDAIKLLLEYEKFPCLWDKTDADYKDRVKRVSAECEILRILELKEFDVKYLRKRLRSLRCTYNQDVAKIMMSKRSGASGDEVYKPKLSWFHVADRFLKKTHEGSQRESNAVLADPSNRLPDKLEEDEDHAMDYQSPSPQVLTDPSNRLPDKLEKDEDHTMDYQSPSPQVIITLPTSPNQPSLSLVDNHRLTSTRESSNMKKKKLLKGAVANNFRGEKRRIEDDSLTEAAKALQEVSKRAKVLDEFQTFAQHVAVQLQQVPLDVAVELQNEIQTLITRRRLDVIRNLPNHVSSDIMSRSTAFHAAPPLTPNLSSDNSGQPEDDSSITDALSIFK